VRFDEAASVVRDAINADQGERARIAVLYEEETTPSHRLFIRLICGDPSDLGRFSEALPAEQRN
jgi:hypothetical protein